VKITVTQEHINKGQQSNCKACPIALAVKEKYTDPEAYILVTGSISVYLPNEGLLIYTLPKKAAKFIESFDRGLSVKPFSFIARKVETYADKS
jgi:hypothetical protein